MTWQRGSMLQSDIVMQPHEPFLLKKVTSRIQICQGCRTSIPHLLIAEVLGAAGVWWIWQTCEAARQSATSYHNKALLPSTFTKNAVVIHCFTFLPPLQHFPFWESDFSGITFQRQPVSSSFHTSLGESPLVSSFTLSFQLSMVSGLTSPSWTMLCLFFHFSSQPLVPLKVSSPILSAIIFDALALVYHSHNKPLISEYFSTFSLFWDWVSSLEFHNSRIVAFCLRILTIWVFPQSNIRTNFLELLPSLDFRITSTFSLRVTHFLWQPSDCGVGLRGLCFQDTNKCPGNLLTSMKSNRPNQTKESEVRTVPQTVKRSLYRLEKFSASFLYIYCLYSWLSWFNYYQLLKVLSHTLYSTAMQLHKTDNFNSWVLYE